MFLPLPTISLYFLPLQTRPVVDTRYMLGENIPTSALNEDLGHIEVGEDKKPKTKGMKKRKPKIYKVAMEEDLPEGADATPVEEPKVYFLYFCLFTTKRTKKKTNSPKFLWKILFVLRMCFLFAIIVV